ncbi:MAG: hypothetical protein Q7N50_05290 [Armatimonadota bacterium]|nr:hypothetical protein [Armatimonadota bacterium]
MAMQDDPLQEAQSNAQRMVAHTEQALEAAEADEMQSQIHESLRCGEQARAFLEETLDSTDEERVILHGEQALEAIEEALDQANQALFSSETAMREHIEQMGMFGEQALAQLEFALGVETV